MEFPYLQRTRLTGTGADLSGADLSEANLTQADLSGANLHRANLVFAHLIETDLRDATLNGSRVYAASVWVIQVNKGTEQRDLRISSPFEAFVTVDNIEVAQFIHLLLNNQEIRNVIDTITSEVVLILGRFSDDRKVVLDHLRDELRKHNYLPIMFDFEPSAHRTTVETIKTLAEMARFVIVDLTHDYGPHRTPILGRPSSSCCRRTPKGQAAESWRRWALRRSVHGPRSNRTSVTPGL